MTEFDSYEKQLTELQRRLKREQQHRKHVETLLAEKQSETECAVAWAQTASETVTALEQQLESAETDLDDAQTRLGSYEKGENPWSLKEESFKQVLQQLHDSQTNEQKIYQQAEELQGKLLEIQGKLKEREDVCTTHEREINQLKEELKAEERQVSELVSVCSSTAETWERYTRLKGEMDQTLGSHLASVGMNGAARSSQAQTASPSIETYELVDRVHELEQAMAEAETSLLEERNKRAMLQEENESLHKYVLKLQEQLYQGS